MKELEFTTFRYWNSNFCSTKRSFCNFSVWCEILFNNSGPFTLHCMAARTEIIISWLLFQCNLLGYIEHFTRRERKKQDWKKQIHFACVLSTDLNQYKGATTKTSKTEESSGERTLADLR